METLEKIVKGVKDGQIEIEGEIYVTKKVNRAPLMGPVGWTGYDSMTRDELIGQVHTLRSCKENLRKEVKHLKNTSQAHLSLASRCNRGLKAQRIVSAVFGVAVVILSAMTYMR